MKIFSLRNVVDDIMLLLRNNNISESEDLSRYQIISWVLAYKAELAKTLNEANKKTNSDDSESSLEDFRYLYGPIDIEDYVEEDGSVSFNKRTINKIPKLLNSDRTNLYGVYYGNGYPIQLMNKGRRFFSYARPYTHDELAAYYENGYVHIEGVENNSLTKIYIDGLFDPEISDDDDEDDISIPEWMVPTIKLNIMLKELAFMITKPSDDSNNSTLDGIKPAGPQEDEK